MTLTQANQKIEAAYNAGLISLEEARKHYKMVARTGDYGNSWSLAKQAERRANWMSDFA